MINFAQLLVPYLDQIHERCREYKPDLSIAEGDFAASMVVATACLLGKAVTPLLPLGIEGERRAKINEFSFKSIYRLFSTIIGLSLVLNKNYFWEAETYMFPDAPKSYLEGEYSIEHDPFIHKIEPDERVYYIIVYGYYFEHFMTQFFVPSANFTDFWVMALHHSVTLCLVMFSYSDGMSHVGVMVAAFHEPSDLFLNWAKMARYLTNYAKGDLWSDVFFVMFLLSWIVFRLILFPYKCIYHVDNYAMASNVRQLRIDSGERFGGRGTKNFAMEVGMCVLVCLHIYWTVLIMRVLQERILGGKINDVRESDTETDQSSTKHPSGAPHINGKSTRKS